MWSLAKTLRFPQQRVGLPLIPHLGTARLVFTNATTITLQQGIIPVVSGGGMREVIPANGITLSNTGLTANTTYLIYYAGGALYASVTAHSTDTDTGIEVMSGDVSKTLVGMVRTGAGVPGVFADSATQRFTISYFNRRSIGGVNAFTINRTTTSATYVEINTEIRCEFVTWSDEAMFAGISGRVTNSTLNAQVTSTSLGLDGATAEEAFSEGIDSAGPGAFPTAISLVKSGLTEGYHFATLLGKTSAASTGTWAGSATAGTRTALTIGIRG